MLTRYMMVAIAAAAVTAAGTSAAAADSDTDARARQQMEQVRRATVQYHDVANAKADGYRQVSPCVDGRPTFDGAMGVHFLNRDLLADPSLDATRPELLVYFPTGGDDLRLVAVEWMKADRDGRLDTDDDRPSLFNQPFHGPMHGHAPGEPVHYELHGWVWQSNPAGLFADWNPSLACPSR